MNHSAPLFTLFSSSLAHTLEWLRQEDRRTQSHGHFLPPIVPIHLFLSVTADFAALAATISARRSQLFLSTLSLFLPIISTNKSTVSSKFPELQLTQEFPPTVQVIRKGLAPFFIQNHHHQWHLVHTSELSRHQTFLP